MYDELERVDIQPARRPTRMTAVWVFLGVIALSLIAPLFRPQPSLIECTEAAQDSYCVIRYTNPILPTSLGLLLMAILLLLAAGLFVRRWHIR